MKPTTPNLAFGLRQEACMEHFMHPVLAKGIREQESGIWDKKSGLRNGLI